MTEQLKQKLNDSKVLRWSVLALVAFTMLCGYTLPANLTHKFYVSKLRIFVSGENLWTGTSLANMFDPETIGGGDDTDKNGNAYPLSKTISFGISVTL